MTTHDAMATRLANLAPHVSYPPTPSLVETVMARLETPVVRSPATRRRWPWVAAAAVAALAAVLVVPPARQAVADLLGIGPVRISQVADLTPAPTIGALGQLTTLEAAAEAVSFDLLTLDDVEPDAVFLDSTVPGGMVTMAFGSPADGWSLLVTQLDGEVRHSLIDKEIGPGTAVEQVTVAGAPGFWIEGAPHTVLLLDATGEPRSDRARLAGDTLVTTRHGIPVRIEADTTLAEAVGIAERLVPLEDPDG